MDYWYVVTHTGTFDKLWTASLICTLKSLENIYEQWTINSELKWTAKQILLCHLGNMDSFRALNTATLNCSKFQMDCFVWHKWDIYIFFCCPFLTTIPPNGLLLLNFETLVNIWHLPIDLYGKKRKERNLLTESNIDWDWLRRALVDVGTTSYPVGESVIVSTGRLCLYIFFSVMLIFPIVLNMV